MQNQPASFRGRSKGPLTPGQLIGRWITNSRTGLTPTDADWCWNYFATGGAFKDDEGSDYTLLYVNETGMDRKTLVAQHRDLLERGCANANEATIHPFWPHPLSEANFTEAAFPRTADVGCISIPGYPPRVRCAYDSKDRLVVIKVTDIRKRGMANEADILLHHGLDLTRTHGYLPDPLRQDPNNHAIPVLQIIEFEDYNFIVMPYWSGGPCSGPPFDSLAQYKEGALQLIQGLKFLHEQNRVHLAINPSHIVMNHFSNRWMDAASTLYGQYPKFYSDKIKYAYIDFEESRIMHAGMRKVDFPPGCYEVPELQADTDPASQLLHDPFKVDVWMLGTVLQLQLEANEAFEKDLGIPMDDAVTTRIKVDDIGQRYMALIASMREPDPSKRVTAKQALEQIENMPTVKDSQTNPAPRTSAFKALWESAKRSLERIQMRFRMMGRNTDIDGNSKNQ